MRPNEQVDVIGLNCQFENVPVVFSGNALANFTKTLGNVTDQYLFAPLWNEYEVVVQLIDRMGRTSQFKVCRHG